MAWRAMPLVQPASSPVGQVYVLHLEPPFGHASHYVGWAVDAERRIAEHRAGGTHAGRLPAHAIAAGRELHVAVIVAGSRWYERWLKNRGSARRFCPLCTGRPLPMPPAARVA